jgi:hypothetical protein
VGYIGFSTKSKNQYTPPEWAGTLLRAFFAVRNQHTVQVKPVEGAQPQPPFCFGFFSASPQKNQNKSIFRGFATPNPPLGKAINRLA